ncbi:MAG: AbrB family transcriptional regulator [Cyanomargarita calcarea GSE-NOS-MK-12-04C]|jgi:hypothetical protein|uniref:AbrB family transcriptional regulator n=1 Tax=Cyanomargarita calcarea GSE-NOS-MK-12-04C TaxID=2839659 RepID=A0A951UUS8_9CYAN|nr:AbrB family transcriptional regulator [Cyanomargarita calcarea GSE-NOS-MK-12-04C]
MSQSLSVAIANKEAVSKQPSVKQLLILGWEILLALPLGLIFSRFNIGGVAWIFAGIASGALIFQSCRIFYDYFPNPHPNARKIGMILVGLTIGSSNAHANFVNVAAGVPVFLILTCFLLLSGAIIGYFYSRLTKINLLTAMLATVPGGVGIMAALAADYGRNVTLVALVQVIRVTSVVLLIPFVARVSSFGSSLNPQTLPAKGVLFSLEPSYLGLLILALLISGLVVYLALLCKIPAAPFFGALLVGIGFNPILNLLPFVTDINFTPPPLINLLGQILLGITIGEYWGDKPQLEKQTITYAFMSVGMTLIAGAIAAILAMQLTSWDWLTCLLVTAPGGSAEIILVALALNHNVEIVTAGHLVRLIAINCSLPLWIFLFRRLDNKLEEAA